MKKRQLLSAILIVFVPCVACLQPHDAQVAQSILDQLYLAAGKFQCPKPTVVVTTGAKRIAAYLPRHNRIEIEEKAYRVCRQFGADSTAALAFLLGHELTHSWQEESNQSAQPPHFLSAHPAGVSARGKDLEHDADLRGLFTAYLAGYNTLDVFPVLIDRLYEAYEMKDKVVSGYPSFSERRQTAQSARLLAENLGALFQSTHWALLMGRSDIAIAGLSHVLQYYQSKELYNNIGLAYLLAAMAYPAPPDVYAFPFEWDTRSRLRNRQNRGDMPLTEEEVHQRQGKLELANHYFTMALSLAPADETARTNQYGCLLMMQQPRQALNLMALHAGQKPLSPAAQIMKGIAYALDGDRAAADRCWSGLEAAADARYKAIAACNRALIDGSGNQIRQCLAQPEWPAQLQDLLKNTPLKKMGADHQLTIYADSLIVFQFENKDNLTQYAFSTEKGRLLSFQRLPVQIKPDGVQINKADFLLSGPRYLVAQCRS
ncbi:MAG: hypothetical protein IPN33_04090 [Saprospiraceae bacterium]|nr:hypothetical protein [Saprospiraceae bacterium]